MINKTTQFVIFCFYILLEKSLHWSLHPKIRSALLTFYGARINRNVSVKEAFFINLHNGFRNLILREGVFLGDNCILDLAGTIEIGARTSISMSCLFITHTDPGARVGNRLAKIFPRKYNGIRIGDDCWVGAGATLLGGVVIGHGSVIGAGSVVTKNIPENVIVAGNPARIIRKIARKN